MFSVVIPLYNKELSISNTIQSVLDQTFQDFEIVIVNDGSTDNSVKEVEKIDDKRIRLIHQENQGVSAARNKGIKEARYEWIAFLDADDLWKENHLETLNCMIEAYPNDMVFTTSFIRSSELKPIDQNNSVEIIDNYFKESMKRTIVCTITICINKKVFEKVGGFLEQFSRAEDIELWNRIGRKYRFIKSNMATSIYRDDSENKLTKTKYRYKSSSLLTIHQRFDYYKSRWEKKYYLKWACNSFANFLKRFEFYNAFKTAYRYFCLLTKKTMKSLDK